MKIWVLMGGMSAEREVSLNSGRAVSAALGAGGHQVWGYELRDGIFLDSLCTPDAPLPAGVGPAVPVRDGAGWAERLMATADWLKTQRIDVAFLALHGDEGEDGTVQALLDAACCPYTGSGPTACAVSMDKCLTKMIMESLSIPTPAWTKVSVERDAANIEKLPGAGWLADTPVGDLPAVVKPIAQGSSVGISIVDRSEEWHDALVAAAAVSSGRQKTVDVLIEKYIPGRELTVGVLNGRALPVVEIRPKTGFYDYTRKYKPGETTYHVPASVDDAVAQRLQRRASDLYTTLGCRGVARVDFRMDPQDDDFCLELNAIPGLTETSLIPKAAAKTGMGFQKLLETLCEAAIRG